MKGKYTSTLKYLAAKLSRVPLRLVLRPLLSWRPMRQPEDGYSVVLACNTRLLPMVGVNLSLLGLQRTENLKELMVVMDRREDEELRAVEASLRARHPDLPIRVLYYTALQERVAQWIQWGWVFSWLSWCKAVAECRTRHLLLHDFDALLIKPTILEDRYREIRARADEFIGVRFYEGNGIEISDRLVTTFELIFDAAFVRDRFRPIHIFNQVAMHKGKSVDFDTFLFAQSRGGRASVAAVDEQDMVHPSQMICQFTDHREGRLPALETNNLLLIPYYIYASGDPEPLRRQRAALASRSGRIVDFYGRPLDLSRLSTVHAAWLTKQAGRVEMAVVGHIRDEVRDYFEQIEAMVSGAAIPRAGEAPPVQFAGARS